MTRLAMDKLDEGVHGNAEESGLRVVDLRDVNFGMLDGMEALDIERRVGVEALHLVADLER